MTDPPAGPAARRARSRRVDSPAVVGLGDMWFASPRRTLLGVGIAQVIEIPGPWPEHLGRVVDVLAAIATDDEVGTAGSGPVAFGALPFDRSAPARMVVPADLRGSTPDGTHWHTAIEPTEPRPDPGGRALNRRLEISAVQTEAEWCGMVSDARQRIRDGRLRKVVLARAIDVEADGHLDPIEIGGRLAAAHPHALRWCIDGFVGASPELLVSRMADVVRAQPMAGTTVRTGDPNEDATRAAELMASTKNRAEHQITIDAVHDALLGWCSYLDAQPQPSVIPAGSVQHLATLVEGRLSHPAPAVTELVAALHPTPAVGGWPRDEAIDLIAELEPVDRGRYAGPVGWVDRHGNGAWAVGLRSAECHGNRARLFAGVGVVEDSDPRAELAETQAKFAATLPHLVVI